MYPRGNLMSILLAVLSCAVIVRGRRIAPLIEEDWAKRPHRAAGKSSQNLSIFYFYSFGLSSCLLVPSYLQLITIILIELNNSRGHELPTTHRSRARARVPLGCIAISSECEQFLFL